MIFDGILPSEYICSAHTYIKVVMYVCIVSKKRENRVKNLAASSSGELSISICFFPFDTAGHRASYTTIIYVYIIILIIYTYVV